MDQVRRSRPGPHFIRQSGGNTPQGGPLGKVIAIDPGPQPMAGGGGQREALNRYAILDVAARLKRRVQGGAEQPVGAVGVPLSEHLNLMTLRELASKLM